MKRFSFTLLFLLSWSVGLHAATDDEARQRLDRALASLDSLQADFRQTVLDEDKQVLSQSSGRVSIHRPGRFRWEYTEPYEQQIIADGKELWVYDVDLDQATVKPIESSLSTAPIMVLMKKQQVSDEFAVKPLGQRKYLYWLELTPKQKDMEYSRIYLGLEGDEIRAMELRDSFGQSTQIVFENPRYGVIFPPGTFRFDPPPGVDVFGAGG
jgi:outer membrane lipoprotein carrier protein